MRRARCFSREASAAPSAIDGSMLVASSFCHSTSNNSSSLLLPLSVATSIWRTADCHSGASRPTIALVIMIWPAFAWLVMRLAVWTAAPKMSRFSSTTGPK